MYNFNYGYDSTVDNQYAAMVSIQAYTTSMKEVNSIINNTLAFIARAFRW